MLPFNSEGEGPSSPPVTVYVGEAVPTGEPQHLKAEPISSTEVHLRWKPPQANMQNGDLLGYKVKLSLLLSLEKSNISIKTYITYIFFILDFLFSY